MVTLFEQVIALALVVGGIVVSALALKNPARRISIGIISVLGLGNLALIVYTYEHTPDVPHFSDLPALFVAVGIKGRDRLAAFAENHLVQLIGVLVIGVILGVIVPREYQKRKRRQWFSSYDIFKLADPALMKNAVLAEDEIQRLMEKISALREEREKLGLVPSPVPHASSTAMVALQSAIREASARDIVLHEQHERARARALGDMYEQLKNGELIAKGFKDPLGLHPKETEIPAAYWKFLKFSTDYKEAEGKGIKYTAIEIART